MSNRQGQAKTSRTRPRASPLKSRLGLLLVTVLAAECVYEPFHLLSEVHYAVPGVPLGGAWAAALDHDHHHGPAHEPHAAADHQRPALGAGAAPAFTPTPAVVFESRLALEGRPAAVRPVIAATTTPPARAPPSPHRPRAPPHA